MEKSALSIITVQDMTISAEFLKKELSFHQRRNLYKNPIYYKMENFIK